MISSLIHKNRHKLKRFLMSKVFYEQDNKFEMVPDLREKGHFCKKKFSQKNFNAKKILDFFIDFKKSNEFNKLSTIENSYDRYKYRKHLTKFFEKKLLENYSEDNFFISNIKQYFGLEPHVRCIDVWMDQPVDIKFQKDSQLYHRDSDDTFLIKTFLCLTEVNENNGPFKFVEGSHLEPWKNISNQHTDHEVEKILYPESRLVIQTAEAGDLYVADTNGFHKGTPLINNIRCLLTVHYVSSKPKNKFLKDKFIY
jgi:hypothetical protein